jgi:hypothetical protein
MGPPSESFRVHPLCDSVGAWCLRSRLQLQISTFQGRKMSIRILGTIAIDVSEIQMCVCENIYGYYVNNEHHTEYDITYLIYIYIL